MKDPAGFAFLFAFLGIAILTGLVSGQGRTEAAYVEKSTGLAFPAAIGELRFGGVEEYEDPGSGVGISYSALGITVTVYVYNAGLADIPSGARSPIHQKALDAAADEIREVSRQGIYGDVLWGPQEIAGLAGGEDRHRARHVKLSYTIQDMRWHSHLFIFGYKDQFIKLRFSYGEEFKASGEEHLKALTRWLSEALKP
jgi:hypothetical protein